MPPKQDYILSLPLKEKKRSIQTFERILSESLLLVCVCVYEKRKSKKMSGLLLLVLLSLTSTCLGKSLSLFLSFCLPFLIHSFN